LAAPEQVTQLLLDWNSGNAAARDELIPIVYEELRRIARRHLRREGPSHTLQTGALVNEAYLRLIDQSAPWRNRAHFFGIAAQMMRRILVDHARAHLYAKRGGGAQQVSLTEAEGLAAGAEDLVALNDALLALAEVDPQQSKIVELKFFAGMTIDEIAEVTGISTATIEREWRSARAWLSGELGR
jgi:RNA polymerase sigma factor (TIGR02999 family)